MISSSHEVVTKRKVSIPINFVLASQYRSHSVPLDNAG